MTRDWPIKVLLAKPGLDGHDRGIKVVMHILRQAGMEVIYTGRRAKIDEIVKTALEENVDVVGISLLSNNHLSISERLLKAMREAGIDDIPAVIGGIIPKEDDPKLREIGIAEIFHVHTPPTAIVGLIHQLVMDRRNRKEA